MARYLYRPGHPLANERGFVDARDVEDGGVALALDAPILVGRFYEDSPPATDGTPINSRRKHREYMKAHGLTVAGDFTGEWAKMEKKQQEMRAGTHRDPERSREIREHLGRAWYEQSKKRR